MHGLKLIVVPPSWFQNSLSFGFKGKLCATDSNILPDNFTFQSLPFYSWRLWVTTILMIPKFHLIFMLIQWKPAIYFPTQKWQSPPVVFVPFPSSFPPTCPLNSTTIHFRCVFYMHSWPSSGINYLLSYHLNPGYSSTHSRIFSAYPQCLPVFQFLLECPSMSLITLA